MANTSVTRRKRDAVQSERWGGGTDRKEGAIIMCSKGVQDLLPRKNCNLMQVGMSSKIGVKVRVRDLKCDTGFTLRGGGIFRKAVNAKILSECSTWREGLREVREENRLFL